VAGEAMARENGLDGILSRRGRACQSAQQ
jgi:hypothetical protein